MRVSRVLYAQRHATSINDGFVDIFSFVNVVETMDAIDLMNQFRRDKTYFDVVDLDPYGTAIPFLEGSITSLANNGLLCVTFTDMAVLCARQPHVCFYKYGAAPLGKPYCHE